MDLAALANQIEFLTVALWGLVFAWLFWFGGSVGSFMNVVVYRLPAGLNLVHPGSRCPRCLHPIRWYHNLPIFGWLLLRGRCRDCGLPISSRYPLIEALVACLFVSLAAVEVLGEGISLPRMREARQPERAREVVPQGMTGPLSAAGRTKIVVRTPHPTRVRHPIAETPEYLWGMYAFHLLLACTLLCAALIEYDARRTQAGGFPHVAQTASFQRVAQAASLGSAFQDGGLTKGREAASLGSAFQDGGLTKGREAGSFPYAITLFAPALVVGIAAPLIWPDLRPVFVWPEPISPGWVRGLAQGATGLLAGVLAGSAVLAAGAKSNATSSPWRAVAIVAPPALCGLFLGRQAAAVIVILAALFWTAGALAAHVVPALRRIGWVGHVTVAGITFLFVWGPLETFLPWSSPLAGPALFAASLAVVALAAVAVPYLRPPDLPSPVHDLPVHKSPASGAHPVANPQENLQAILNSPTYRLSELDTEFLARPELRPVRMQLELLKPQMALDEQRISSTVVVFGGTAIVERPEAERRLAAAHAALTASPDDPALQRAQQRAERVAAKSQYYDHAREFGRLVSSNCQINGQCDYVVITGGGPGIMEAANRGAFDIGAKSIGLNITLPSEQAPNPYITPELCFQFHYFALRKMHFLLRAKALVVFPGGFGTLDELTDALTLRQTERMQVIPIIMYGREYWRRVIDFQFLADEGVIADQHLDLVQYADTPEEAWRIIATFHRHGEPK